MVILTCKIIKATILDKEQSKKGQNGKGRIGTKYNYRKGKSK